jgi:uncharacterized protein
VYKFPLVFTFALLILFTFFATSTVISVFAQTIPTIRPYVNDLAGVLTQQEISSINSFASEIEKNTTVQVAVLTVNTTQPMAIEDYSLQVFRTNGIGQKQNNNGILIVVAIDDRKYWIEVGYGLEGLINDAKAGDIERNCFVSNFRSSQYGTGILCAVQSIGSIVQGQPEVIATNEIDTNTILLVFGIIGIFLLPIFIVLIIFAKDEFYQKCPRDGTRLHMHIRKDGIIYECAKCGYKKKKKRRQFVWIWLGGMGGGGGWSGGGGGGFGGGSSGGGGAGGGW